MVASGNIQLIVGRRSAFVKQDRPIIVNQA